MAANPQAILLELPIAARRDGRHLVVTRGHYVVTMVHQAPDDNHLKLIVR